MTEALATRGCRYGERWCNATHCAPIDPDARLGRKAKTHEAKLAYPLDRAYGQPLAGLADELDGRARHPPGPVRRIGRHPLLRTEPNSQ